LGTTMWARRAQQVDNEQLFTARENTSMQDVVCDSRDRESLLRVVAQKTSRRPQSTALITVIKDLSIHPQITMEPR
jgi:hypothetical protein